MKRWLVVLLVSLVLLSAWYFFPRYEPAQIPTVNNTRMAETYASMAVRLLTQLDYASELEEYQEVIYDIQKAVELDPLVKLDVGLARAYVRMGDYYYERRNHWVWDSNYGEAAANYAKALEIDPLVNCRTPIDVYYGLIEEDLYSRNYNMAIRRISEALAFKQDSEGYHLLARAYHDRAMDNPTMRPDEAIADISKAIELDPNNFEYYNSRASIYRQFSLDTTHGTGKLLRYANALYQAIADYTKAIEMAPENADGYWERGSCYSANAEHAKAIMDYTKAIELGKEDAYYYRALLYETLGDNTKALVDYRKCLLLSGDQILKELSLKHIEELVSK
ncbi:hypothetical protein ACFLU4_02015 [Chloroflexota bacterium]